MISNKKINPSISLEEIEPTSRKGVEVLKEKDDGKHIVQELLNLNFWFLRIFGSYHRVNDHLAFKFYCILTILLLWYNSIKAIFSFNFTWGNADKFGSVLVLNIITFIWYFLCAITSSVYFLIQSRKSKISKFEKNYEEIFIQYEEDVDTEKKFIKKIVLISTLICFSVSIANTILNFSAMFGSGELKSIFLQSLAPFQYTSWVNSSTSYTLFSAFTISFAGHSFMLSLSYYFNYCFLAIRLLKGFNKKFKDLVSNKEISLKEQSKLMNEDAFDQLADWFLKLTSLLRCLNDCFKEFIGFVLLLTIPATFLLIWIIITWSSSCVTGLLVFVIPLWTFISITTLLFVILVAVQVNVLV